ncbi:hypothetical protein ACFP1I_12875 [Dyadobacter subterraneus]|uniref:Secreted protein n=1 Tax=Dyadobacter subterraneus TaxID=2773304 RepID=A0ABR9WD07_9BACT|nr:hypothetical protein [Dyadobacter subterraneus]MBE9462124.1 hypothetical protein [Dyadobacter subterraneus]
MKKLKFDLLFAAALMLGGGLAVAHSATTVANTVFYNDAAEGQPEHWQPVPSGRTVSCDENPDNECTQTRNESGIVISSQAGDASLL